MQVNGFKSKAEALRAVNQVLANHGYGKISGLLAAPESNPKLAKSGKVGVMAWPMHLAPARLSGFEVCPMRSEGCTAACLHTAGNPAYMAQKEKSRIARTQAYMRARKAFMAVLAFEIAKAQDKAKAADMLCGIRLNATSDLPWEAVGVEIDGIKHRNLMEAFGGVQFYDYTKVPKRAIKSVSDPRWPFNYHLTFSKAEDNDHDCLRVLQAGGNVTVVFGHKVRPNFVDWAATDDGETWIVPRRTAGPWSIPVVDGDAHDYRPEDGQGVVVGLKAKGEAKHDTSGFVVR